MIEDESMIACSTFSPAFFFTDSRNLYPSEKSAQAGEGTTSPMASAGMAAFRIARERETLLAVLRFDTLKFLRTLRNRTTHRQPRLAYGRLAEHEPPRHDLPKFPDHSTRPRPCPGPASRRLPAAAASRESAAGRRGDRRPVHAGGQAGQDRHLGPVQGRMARGLFRLHLLPGCLPSG